MTLRLRLLAVLAVLATCAPGARAADFAFVSVGTGAVGGVYYPVAQAICRIVNAAAAGRMRCSPESTPGSVYNVGRLATGELDFAIIQSDIQFDAVTGRANWAGKPTPWLRSVMSLHPELLTIVARRSTGIDSLEGLQTRRLNIGTDGSGARTTWLAVETAAAWPEQARVRASGFKVDVALHALCSGGIDATLMLVGHPSPMVRHHLDACETRIVPLSGPAIDNLVQSAPYFRRGSIPAGLYGNADPIDSFGVSATLVTSASADEGTVYEMTRAILTQLEELKQAHPALAGLSAARMVRDARTAPLHPGAARAFAELGLLK
jgi:TRAP transporter TAXI family solute receptor